MGDMTNVHKIYPEYLKERYYLEDLDVEGRIILKLISRKQGGRLWIGVMWLRTGSSGGIW
jgi:hypothetical protein